MSAETPSCSAENIVAALYRALLGRRPDPKGFQGNTASLRGLADTEESLADYFSLYTRSPEFRDRQTRISLSHLMRAAPAASAPGVAMSLGGHCLTAFALKEIGVKRESYPFDWIFSNLAMIDHCLCDDFKTFLDPSYYRSSLAPDGSESTGKCEHAFYREKFSIGSLFNHRDVRIEENYDYTLRCVERFRAALARPERKYLFHLTMLRNLDNNKILRLLNTLSALCGNFTLVVISVDVHDGNRRGFGVNISMKADNLIIANMNSTSKAGPLSFNDAFDDLIFRRFICSVLN